MSGHRLETGVWQAKPARSRLGMVRAWKRDFNAEGAEGRRGARERGMMGRLGGGCVCWVCDGRYKALQQIRGNSGLWCGAGRPNWGSALPGRGLGDICPLLGVAIVPCR